MRDAANRLIAFQRTVAATVPDARGVRGVDLHALGAKLDELASLDYTTNAEPMLAALYARCAAIAIAAGNPKLSRRWLDEAELRAPDPRVRAELAAGRIFPDRFRALTHGRALLDQAITTAAQTRSRRKLWRARAQERMARAIWKQLLAEDPLARDAIATAAQAALDAPRPMLGRSFELVTVNGFGTRFAGRRDRRRDGTYIATRCLALAFIPLIPLAAYRVRPEGEGWRVLARERLSRFAVIARWVVIAGIAAAIAGGFLLAHYLDPDRVARVRFERALAAAAEAPTPAARRGLEEVLHDRDRARVDPALVQRAGAELLRLTAATAPSPFRREHGVHADRLVQDYRLLPTMAQGQPAREVVLATLARWAGELGDTPDTAEVRLALLLRGAPIADAAERRTLQPRLDALRIAIANARALIQPLAALAILVEDPTPATLARANPIAGALVESPSLLADAGPELDSWIAATAPGEPLRAAAIAKRAEAIAGRNEANAERITPARLAAMEKARPWDQFVQLRLARLERTAGKHAAALARMQRLAARGPLVRDARALLDELAAP